MHSFDSGYFRCHKLLIRISLYEMSCWHYSTVICTWHMQLINFQIPITVAWYLAISFLLVFCPDDSDFCRLLFSAIKNNLTKVIIKNQVSFLFFLRHSDTAVIGFQDAWKFVDAVHYRFLMISKSVFCNYNISFIYNVLRTFTLKHYYNVAPHVGSRNCGMDPLCFPARWHKSVKYIVDVVCEQIHRFLWS